MCVVVVCVDCDGVVVCVCVCCGVVNVVVNAINDFIRINSVVVIDVVVDVV